jgi:cystathionine beta-lyase
MSSEYDFSEVISRTETDSYKWDLRQTNRRGQDVLPMWVADMDFPVADVIHDALSRRLDHPVFGYTFFGDAYKAAFIRWEQEHCSWAPLPGHLVYVPSVMPAVRTAILEFTRPGDGVVVQPPVYYPFFDAITENGRVVVENPLIRSGDSYTIDMDHLERLLTPRTPMLILCSPHNPVGRVWTRDELAAVVEVCERNEVLILCDEIHSDITRDSASFVPIGSFTDEAIVCTSPTKSFNIAGLASGLAIIANEQIRSRFTDALSRLGHTLPNVMSLEAGRAAYAEGGVWLAQLNRYLDDQIIWFGRQLATRMPQVGVSPIEGTYLAWLDFSAVTNHREGAGLQQRFLEEGGLWLSDGRAFGTGGEDHLRMNLACPRALLEEGVRRLEAMVEALQ